MLFLKRKGVAANKSSPRVAITGENLTVFAILNLWEKKENARSIRSCVAKLISTSVPKREKETP